MAIFSVTIENLKTGQKRTITNCDEYKLHVIHQKDNKEKGNIISEIDDIVQERLEQISQGMERTKATAERLITELETEFAQLQNYAGDKLPIKKIKYLCQKKLKVSI